MTSSILDAALLYASNGWHVLPVNANSKLPAIKSWPQQATTVQDAIQKWLQNYPDRNLGIATGGKSDLFVIDVDVKKEAQGRQTLEHIESVFGTIKTLRALTPSGGFHLYFRHPQDGGKSKANVLPGVDVRTDGGFVVAPPSSIDGKAYEWVDDTVPPSEVPEWLLAILKHGLELLPPQDIKEGGRNDALFKYVLGLRRRNLDENLINLFAEKANQQFSPPMPMDEVQSILASAQKYDTSGADAFDFEECGIEVDSKPPSGFVCRDTGVFYYSGNKSVWIASPLMVIGLTRDNENQNWGRLVLIKDRDGKQKTWAMPMELLKGDGSEIRANLLHLGAEISPQKNHRDMLLQYIQGTKTEKRYRCSNRIGWRGKNFVLPDETIGENDERIIWQSVNANYDTYKTSGVLEEWQEQVASQCVGQSRLVFALSAAFTAPILYLLSEESGGFHFRGDSSIGKTTCLHVAASVWGGGEKEYICTWRATSNGLESIAEAHCDTLLLLDELSQVHSKEVGETAYMLANGQGKTRARKDGIAKPPAVWRTLFLSTGEVTLADKMAQVGQKVQAGMETRMADIPADAAKGSGIFDHVPEQYQGAAEYAKALKESSKRYYGVACRAFLQELVTDIDGYTDLIKRKRDELAEMIIPAHAGGQVKRVAYRFALVAASGECAISMGILPFNAGEPTQAMKTCFAAWLEERGTTESTEIQRAIFAIASFIERYVHSRFMDIDAMDYHYRSELAGYASTNPEGQQEYYLTVGTWAELIEGFNKRSINKALIDAGILIPCGNKSSKLVKPKHEKKAMRLYHVSHLIHAHIDGKPEEGEEVEERQNLWEKAKNSPI